MAGAFPHNRWSPEPIHQLRDPEGHLCAIANLVHLDGHDDVLDAMSVDHDDVLVAEEKSGALHDWVLTSGLTAEEVAAIQEAEMFVPDVAAQREADAASTKHFLKLEQLLIADEQASLDLAVARVGTGNGAALAAR